MLPKITRTPVRSSSFPARSGVGIPAFLALCLTIAGASTHASTVSLSAFKDPTILGTSGEAEEAVPRSVVGFWSKDGAAATGNPALAPTLEINYSPIPEPETWGMMMGVLALLAWRMGRSKTRQASSAM
jgi:hypothetical protein